MRVDVPEKDIEARPTFGVAPAREQPLKARLAAYAVILEPDGIVAAVRGEAGVFLPGGGSLPAEPPESTVLREVKEECGCAARIIQHIGEATQYFQSAGSWYKMLASFYLAQFEGVPDGSGEHELIWLNPGEEGRFYHECHSWAVSLARGVHERPGRRR
jgi:8-oxo-dGTP diphosphatase